ncbi:MAG TPA: undecaprenyldiphospho-muramoylpentapeptide beta-N-acetylglucosaminyltransferase [Acidobacteriota bacterium]|nr:undecaprenyldiphospho-muramoylpentapeptide beta-N-acetylglucosaminyltransferase [Acidobacteriota bacterium]
MTGAARSARLLFAGGGTGGHLFPAIAIADRVTELLGAGRSIDIRLVGTKRGLEYRIRESLGYPLDVISVRGLARSLTIKNLLVPFVLLGAMIKARSLLNRFRPHVVVGTGGYVSLPVLRMAAAAKIATVLQEQNSYPGISSRKIAPHAARVYLGFEGARRHLRTRGRVMVTGNPVRRSITSGNRQEAVGVFGLDPRKKTILVLGGSQGARDLNAAILKGLKAASLPEGYQLLWQTGKRGYKDVIAQAGEKVEPHSLFPFEERMDLVYAATDLAIARAGALTLAELQACHIPAILIPYPFAAGDHQIKNAREVADSGFAEIIEQAELDRCDLLERAVTVCRSGRADRMRESIIRATTDRKPAVDIIAEDLIDLLEQQQAWEGGVDS